MAKEKAEKQKDETSINDEFQGNLNLDNQDTQKDETEENKDNNQDNQKDDIENLGNVLSEINEASKKPINLFGSVTKEDIDWENTEIEVHFKAPQVMKAKIKNVRMLDGKLVLALSEDIDYGNEEAWEVIE